MEHIYMFRPHYTNIVSLSLFTYGDELDVMELPCIEYWCNWDLRGRSSMPLADAGPAIVSASVVAVLRALESETTFVPALLWAHPRWRGTKSTDVPWSRTHVPRATEPAGISDSQWFAFDDAPGLDCIDWSNVDDGLSIGRGSVMAHPIGAGVVRPADGFPPLFAVEHALGSTFFISSEVRTRLLKSGVRGIDFGKPIPVRESPLKG